MIVNPISTVKAEKNLPVSPRGRLRVATMVSSNIPPEEIKRDRILKMNGTTSFKAAFSLIVEFLHLTCYEIIAITNYVKRLRYIVILEFKGAGQIQRVERVVLNHIVCDFLFQNFLCYLHPFAETLDAKLL